MKNIRYNILLVLLVAITLVSCRQDLLDLSPKDKVGGTTMWKTENLVDQGVNGIYNTLRQARVGHIFNQVEMSVEADETDLDNAVLADKATSGSAIFGETWQQHYEGIHRANDAIVNIPNSPVSAEKKGRYIAEAKLLRAFFYYRLNILYKGVPIYLEPVESNQANRPRNTETEVWNQILKDLTDCINEEYLPVKYKKGDINFGRMTKTIALSLRGKSYLYLKEWAKAEADFKAVGDAGHTLFQGEYKDLFKEANEQSDEMIFSVQEIGISGLGTNIPLRYGSRIVYQEGWNTYIPNTDFVDSYAYADGEKFDWAKIFPKWNELSPRQRSVYFLRNNMVESEKNYFINDQKVDLTDYLPDGNEERLLKAYENRDPRLKATIITPYSEFLGSINSADVIVTLRWPYRIDKTPPHDIRTDTNNRFYYLFRKFVPEGTSEVPNRSYSPIDFPLIRYADIVLSLAEALMEQDKLDEAISYVNQVRRRVNIAELNSNEHTQVLGKDDLRYKIQQEKRWEFNGEGVNLYDELRWKTWKESKFFKSAGLKQIWGENQYTYSWPGDEIYQWPVPRIERERNGNLEQSPGWRD